MSMISLPHIRLHLSSRLDATDKYLPLDMRGQSELYSCLADGEYVILTISDERYTEIIKLENMDGTFVATRGIDGSVPRNFPCGATLTWSATPSVLAWYVCSYECDASCAREPVTYTGEYLPPASVGVPWEGTVNFNGSLPINIGVSGAPSWMQVVAGANYIRLSGVPTSAGTVVLTVGAANLGTQLDARTCEVIVNA